MALGKWQRSEAGGFRRFVRIGVVSVALLSRIPPVPATTSDRLFSIGTVHGYFGDVLRASLTARPDTERAAFIISHADGSFGCQLWPPMSLYHREVFHGSLPRGTLAIIHTHSDASPRPSIDDQFEADRLGIPIYVLTRRDVFKAEPGGRVATSVVRREWWLKDPYSSQQRCE
jgi:hypothetical protein